MVLVALRAPPRPAAAGSAGSGTPAPPAHRELRGHLPHFSISSSHRCFTAQMRSELRGVLLATFVAFVAGG